jgi:predicted small metal-binding protein
MQARITRIREVIQPTMEDAMTRMSIDCRAFPSKQNCTVAISADSEEELLEAAVEHAVTVHEHTDTPELRQQLRKMFKRDAATA